MGPDGLEPDKPWYRQPGPIAVVAIIALLLIGLLLWLLTGDDGRDDDIGVDTTIAETIDRPRLVARDDDPPGDDRRRRDDARAPAIPPATTAPPTTEAPETTPAPTTAAPTTTAAAGDHDHHDPRHHPRTGRDPVGRDRARQRPVGAKELIEIAGLEER